LDAHARAAVHTVRRHYDVLLSHLHPAGEPPVAPVVTVSQGDRTVAVSTPDDQGRIRLTVSDAAGESRYYELDLGRTGPSSVTGSFGEAAGTPGPAAPEPPSPRLPATLAPWAIRPVERLRPEEDGTVVIRDGRVTITVDPDEVAGELTVTLDDGAGHRTTYRVDYRDPANPTLHQAAERAAPARLAPVRELGRPR